MIELILAVALAATPSVDRTEVAQLGNMRAELSYSYTKDEAFGIYRDVALTIIKNGEPVFERRVPPPCRRCPMVLLGAVSGKKSVRVVRLTGAPGFSVVVDLYTGGAHCCFVAYAYRPSGSGYGRASHDFGNSGYRLRDLDGDGSKEFVSSDDRFFYIFTSYGASQPPIEIWRLVKSRFRRSTARFPSAVRGDARAHLRSYSQERRRPRTYRDVRGILAGYVADQYLLGRPAQGWAVVHRALRLGELHVYASCAPYWPCDGAYIAKLRAFLRRTGYAR